MGNLRLVQVGLFVVFAGVATQAIAVLLPVAAGATGIGALFAIFVAIGVLLTACSFLGSLVGSLLCLAVPPDSGTRPLLIASLVCNLAGSGLGYAGSGWGGLVSLVGSILFLMFLSSLGRWFGRPDVAEMVSNVVKMALGGGALMVLGGIMMFPLIIIVGLLLVIASVVFYGMVVFSLAQLAGQRADAGY